MIINKKNYSIFKDITISSKFFIVAIFFLVSAPFISCLLLTCTFLINYKNFILSFKENKSNYFLVLISFLMIVSFIEKSINAEKIIEGIDPSLTLISLANWIPLFIVFIGSKQFLNNEKKREKIMKALCIGTIPLLASGIGQYFLNFHGPFSILNGLIIWYQRPILGEVGQYANGISGLTGLFNNANTAGDWLLTILPMQFYFLLKKNNSNYEKLFFFVISILSVLSLILTNSRSAIIGLTSIFSFLLGSKILSLFLLFLFFTLIFMGLIYLLTPSLIINFYEFLNLKFINSFFLGLSSEPRIGIWKNTLNFIVKRPIFGYGAASIALLYKFYNFDLNIIHTHNIFGELSINYGLPTAIFLGLFIFNLIFKNFKNFNINFLFIEKLKDSNNVWVISCFLILYTQLVDFTYYDLRISILFWTILSGLSAMKTKKIM